MHKSTTPTHTFKFTDNTDNFTKIIATYSQNGSIVLEKTQDDMTFSTQGTYYLAAVTLTQEETNLFNPDYPCFVQIKVKTSDGVVQVSQKVRVDVESVLNEEVI